MTTNNPNTVPGGNEALNQALVIAQQVGMLIPTVGVITTTIIGLIQGLRASGGVDAATEEEARQAVMALKQASQRVTQTAEDWLAAHPAER
jgi:hypothetical protein